MTSNQIRRRFLDFFKDKNHAVLNSAPLVTSDTKGLTNSTLFNTAGVQPLIPYLLGETHPEGKRLASVQKCLRTTDIEEVSDATHATFFEMLGNWSLGDYFKEEAIKLSFEFLTDKEVGLGLDPERLYVTVFEGDENAPKDDEAFSIWKKYLPASRIYFMSADSNWWSAGDNGPCGPDTEMFYDITKDGLGELSKEAYIKADEEQKVVEIWNDVFMEYEKKDGEIKGKLSEQNVDTGSGLERITMVTQGKDSIFDTDLFSPLIEKIKKEAENYNTEGGRIIADHLKAVSFMLTEGVLPSNTDRGYILRRLLRRAIRWSDKLKIENIKISDLADIVALIYKDTYPEITENLESIKKAIDLEEIKFRKRLKAGLKELEKGTDPFILFTTYGFPVELTKELRAENGQDIDLEDFAKKLKAHQDLSRTGAAEKFKGGLASHDQKSIQYHTATHLLHQALREVLGDHVSQKGSNITTDRLRFDFTHSAKMTDGEKKSVEDLVNQKIKEGLPVKSITLPKAEAEKTAALHFFGDKYGDEVNIYYIGESLEGAFSKEFCGGPHIKNTSELSNFKIKKEESVASGTRRIKATLE